MRVLQLLIDRDAVQKTACEKWAADLPILRALYGDDDKVVVLGYYDVDVEERSPHEEYERLKKTYGLKPQTDTPWVEYIYGRSMDALAQAMKGEGLFNSGEEAGETVAIKEIKPPPTTSAPKKKAAKKTASK